MAQQIWYPDNDDEVRMKDGRVGKVTDEDGDPVCNGPGDWQISVAFEEEDSETDVEVSYNEKEKAWEEAEA